MQRKPALSPPLFTQSIYLLKSFMYLGRKLLDLYSCERLTLEQEIKEASNTLDRSNNKSIDMPRLPSSIFSEMFHADVEHHRQSLLRKVVFSTQFSDAPPELNWLKVHFLTSVSSFVKNS